MNTNSNKKDNYIDTIFNHNLELIKLADTKANIVIGINSILIPLVFSLAGFNFINLIEKNFLVHAFILNTSSILSLVFLGISFIFSIFVIKARLLEKLENKIFFKNIIKYKFSEYHRDIISMKNEEIIEDLLKEIYLLAKINEKKYERYKHSLTSLIIGILILIIGYIFVGLFNYSSFF